ncbi:MAG TPA: lycopene cyclase family protein [Panacibacter sp.]|nr:lycopene cyclase family protein [Panacibacter sp.]HNP46720.1 lycopene cyclase family protein [Panacibacter sp.]
MSGSGCAGLSLLHCMMQRPFFDNKKILVVDQSPKSANDRTWCFWEQRPGMFEPIVHHRWEHLAFYSDYYSARFDIDPYAYKMIRGIDFYQYVLGQAKHKPNIEFLYGKLQSLAGNESMASMIVDGTEYTGTYIFNSINLAEKKGYQAGGRYYSLLQHFKGWLIQTPVNCFDPGVATFMDFRVDQKHGTTFVYVLPVAGDKALVEYTLFTQQLLQPQEYDHALGSYLSSFAGIKDYAVLEEEFGIIPMTNFPFSKGDGNVVTIGTAGGQTKASSGFTFQFIQKHTGKIVDALMAGRDPHISNNFAGRRFSLYDSTLLNILSNKKMGGDKIFADLFRSNPPQRVLRFLDNETNFPEELKIMRSVPAGIFFPAAMQELFR